jgi:Protein of unknown function (DUF1554)
VKLTRAHRGMPSEGGGPTGNRKALWLAVGAAAMAVAGVVDGCVVSQTCESDGTCPRGDAGGSDALSQESATSCEDDGTVDALCGTDSGDASTEVGPDVAGGADAGSDADAQVAESAADAGSLCGNGRLDPGEQCDLGAANMPDAYGKGACTTQCMNAPYCGDGIVDGPEVCDGGDAGSNALGACNPECSGYYTKKTIKPTMNLYSTNLGGIVGADMNCKSEFGPGWKALLVGGNRQATGTPFVGDQQDDWVIKKYTCYYNAHDQLMWITDNVTLLGVRQGRRVSLNNPAFDVTGQYPWTGWATDWTTIADNPATSSGTCRG